METRVNYTVAGIFVIALVTTIVLIVIWLSAGITNEKFTYYRVYMTESVSGLTLGAPVEFNGVDVGTVDNMIISRKNPQLVELYLKVKEATPVTFGTRAKLGMRALTGVAYMLLEDKGKDMRPVIPKEEPPFPIIPTTPSILVRLDTTLTQLNESFKNVSNSIQSLLDKENLAWFKKILQSGKISLQIIQTRTLPETNEAIKEIGNVSRDISDLTNEIKEDPSLILRGKPQPRPGPGE